jgi:deoxyhypusine synthase
LDALVPLDLRKVGSFEELLVQMKSTAFGGRSVGEATDTIFEMVSDEECFVILTLSGAMTVAKMGLIISDIVEYGLVDAIVSTGALICHGLVESFGMQHFKLPRDTSDVDLYSKGYCRIYDTIELEKNLDDLEVIIHNILSDHDSSIPLSSHSLCEKIGKFCNNFPGTRSILGSCYEKSVPVFIPAFTDSEIALDLAIFNNDNVLSGKNRLSFDPFLDLEKYFKMALPQKKLGIITIGGGVPRNWAQQIGPYADVLYRRKDINNDTPVRFHYGVRICPEPTHWGGLSGCTYSEGVSWGKFLSPDEGGKYAEVYSDATIALPLIAMGVFQRMGIFD